MIPDVALLQRQLPRAIASPARVLIRVGILLYAVESLLYLAFGQLNADEGWYLYGSKLAFQGLLPYQDFAYTQMPLLLYVYGVLQTLIPGLLLGRLTSIAISFGTVGMGIQVARRYGGIRAAAIAALLYAAFTFGVYFNSISKTYALVSFCFTATLFVMSLHYPEERKYPLALLFAFAATLVRISAAAFVVPMFLYLWISATRLKTRILLLAVTIAASALAGLFLLPDWPAARWDLFDSHLRHWAGAQISTQTYFILSQRVPDIIQHFGLVLLLMGGATYVLFRSHGIKKLFADYLPLWFAALGLALFAASHLVNGLWDIEYLVPAVTVFLPILAVVLGQAYDAMEGPSRLWAEGTLAAALILFPLSESLNHVDFTGRRLPLAEVSAAASFIAEHTEHQDQVLALEALSSVLQARRSTLPGMTLAQFSVQLMDAPTAQKLHLVNTAMLADAVNRKAAKLVVLTEYDWGVLRSYDRDSADRLQRDLNDNYNIAWSMQLFGQNARNVWIFASRE